MTARQMISVLNQMPDDIEIAIADGSNDVLEPLGVTACSIVYNFEKDCTTVVLI